MKKFICLILVLSLLFSSVGAVEVYEVQPDTQPLTFSKFAMRSVSALADVGPVLLYGSDVLSIMQPGFSTMAAVVYVYHPETNIGVPEYGGVTLQAWSEWRDAPSGGTSFTVSSSSSSLTDYRIFSSSSIDLESNLNGGEYRGLQGLCTDPSNYISDIDYPGIIVTDSVPDYFPVSLDLSQFGDFYSFSLNGLLTVSADCRGVDSGSYTDLGKAYQCWLVVNGSIVETFYPDENGTFDFAYYEYDSDQLITEVKFIFRVDNNHAPLDVNENIVGRYVIQSDQASEIQFFSDIGLKTFRQTVVEALKSTITSYLGSDGIPVSGSGIGVADLIANGFLGLRAHMGITTGSFLGDGGRVYDLSDFGFSHFSLPYVVSNGLLGVRSLISGSESDNIYSGVSINNENVSSTFSVSGLGPMLHTWLGDIQNDLGVLSYVFASPQDLELKKESESNMDAVGETILSSDSKSSVKVKDITDISAASDSIQELGETGVTPGQAFEQLGNSDLFSFFSAETAANLDTTVSTYSRDPSQQIVTSYYQDNRLEFFDVIGKEVGW